MQCWGAPLLSLQSSHCPREHQRGFEPEWEWKGWAGHNYSWEAAKKGSGSRPSGDQRAFKGSWTGQKMVATHTDTVSVLCHKQAAAEVQWLLTWIHASWPGGICMSKHSACFKSCRSGQCIAGSLGERDVPRDTASPRKTNSEWNGPHTVPWHQCAELQIGKGHPQGLSEGDTSRECHRRHPG